ncbi:Apoptosis inhibitor IAP [Symbiodinium microadriaticum]|uniref:Apoptosis inhibitor IAP n=1 Tax=Symbiodinium microadriaticum TaxID=2951 RepID=A0A1Q9ELN0_SYMMI|nr:Apoptosis inhibitor IAP [Symbiodinium microadriaticum]
MAVVEVVEVAVVEVVVVVVAVVVEVVVVAVVVVVVVGSSSVLTARAPSGPDGVAARDQTSPEPVRSKIRDGVRLGKELAAALEALGDSFEDKQLARILHAGSMTHHSRCRKCLWPTLGNYRVCNSSVGSSQGTETSAYRSECTPGPALTAEQPRLGRGACVMRWQACCLAVLLLAERALCRTHLCIFIPISQRSRKDAALATAALETWAAPALQRSAGARVRFVSVASTAGTPLEPFTLHVPGDEEGVTTSAYVQMLVMVTYRGNSRSTLNGEDEEEDSNLCAICFDKEKKVILKPCGHDQFCFSCALRVRTCPLCRAALTSIEAIPGGMSEQVTTQVIPRITFKDRFQAIIRPWILWLLAGLVFWQNSGWLLSWGSGAQHNVREMVLATVLQNGGALVYASDRFLDDRDIVLAALHQDGTLLRYAAARLRGDREVALAAVHQDGRALEHVALLDGDREVVLAAVLQQGVALRYAAEKLRGDRDLVLTAVRRDPTALRYASLDLKDDAEIVLEALQRDPQALQYATVRLRGDRDIVLQAVRRDGMALQHASKELLDDREVVLAAVHRSGDALYVADDNFLGDREVMLEAVRHDGQALLYAHADVRNDRGVVLAAVHQNVCALQHASAALLTNCSFLVQALENRSVLPRLTHVTFRTDCHGIDTSQPSPNKEVVEPCQV